MRTSCKAKAIPFPIRSVSLKPMQSRTAFPAYIYELAGCVNKFYHETRILSEEDTQLQAGYIALIGLAKNILESCIDLLGFSAPEKM